MSFDTLGEAMKAPEEHEIAAARFRVAERQRMDDYAARRAGGGMYA